MNFIAKYRHFMRANLYVFESLLPRLGTFIFLPILIRFIESVIWTEIVLMIAVSEILSKIYLFGYQNAVFRFGKNMDHQIFKLVSFKLLKRLTTLSILIFLFLNFLMIYFGVHYLNLNMVYQCDRLLYFLI